MTIIKMPIEFSPEMLPELQRKLVHCQHVDSVTVDFSTLKYSYPLGMLVAGSILRKWVERRRLSGFATQKIGVNSRVNCHAYLMHLGFFDFITMTAVGKKIGVAKGNTKYVPIKVVKRDHLEAYALLNNMSFMDALIEVSNSMARVLAGDTDFSAQHAFNYAIREAIRNALEHSTSNSCIVCAQRWVNGSAEIAILDEGVGLYTSLQAAYDIEVEDALELAIKPGITRASILKDHENEHKNSGFGLYVLSELSRSFGWFCIGSGVNKLTLEGDKKVLDELFFRGVFLGVHLNSAPKNFEQLLKDIIDSGEQESKLEGRLSKASGFSRSI